MTYKAIGAFLLLLLLAMGGRADNYPVKYLGIDQGLSNNVVITGTIVTFCAVIVYKSWIITLFFWR